MSSVLLLIATMALLLPCFAGFGFAFSSCGFAECRPNLSCAQWGLGGGENALRVIPAGKPQGAGGGSEISDSERGSWGGGWNRIPDRQRQFVSSAKGQVLQTAWKLRDVLLNLVTFFLKHRKPKIVLDLSFEDSYAFSGYGLSSTSPWATEFQELLRCWW